LEKLEEHQEGRAAFTLYQQFGVVYENDYSFLIKKKFVMAGGEPRSGSQANW
jgi:hypothetical protein